MKVRSCGDRALLVEVDGIDAVLGLYSSLTRPLPTGVTELVPAARTLLVRFDPALTDAPTLAELLADTEPVPATSGNGDAELVTIPVCYDGEDLDEVGQRSGLGTDGVIAAHTNAEYVVAFGGFAPGFGYLTGLDPRLHMPRHATPRTSVPAGAVAIAGEFAGVYPRSSPGGWQILGHTTARLWDPDRSTPALLRPGVRVRFRRAHQGETAAKATSPARTASQGCAPRAIEVRRPGPLTTVQDLGRPGMAALGISPSGAADRRSATLANRLVGNAEGTACLETTFGGLTLRFHRRAARVVVTGAPCPVTRDGRGEAMNAPFTVAPGQELVLGTPSTGLRSYLAVRGGIEVPQTLRSRATDVLSGLGPPPLSAGDTLAVGDAHCGPPPAIDVAPVTAPPQGELTVRVLPGPRDDWFPSDTVRTLSSARYVVSAQSNRIGVRLEGPPLTRARDGELPSEGIVAGAVQVPPSGRPVVFLADHPITGGYPVIAVVRTEDLPVVAQARPGQVVRFRIARMPSEATNKHRERNLGDPIRRLS